MVTALLDACVLYPAPIRDLLVHLACADVFRARWTDQIHDEWMRNLLAKRKDLRAEQLLRTRELMNAAVRDCLVTGFEPIVASLALPDSDDRHVLAAAIRGRADVIVTYNTRDFPDGYLAQFGIEAQHPDDFIAHQFDIAQASVCEAVKRHRASLRNPPKSVDEYLQTLMSQQLANTAERLRAFSALL